MRRGVEAGTPPQYNLASGHHGSPQGGPRDGSRGANALVPVRPAPPTSAQTRAKIAQLFAELRRTLRANPQQIASHLSTHVQTIEALETGMFDALPAWPETVRVVASYTALAGIDGRPVLAAIAEVIRASVIQAPDVAAPSRGKQRVQVERLMRAGNAFANGAKRLPAGAMKQVRERPDRAFYAVSLPLGLVILMLNTSVLEAAFHHVPRPVSRLVQDIRQFCQEQFAPVRGGLRWIDVDDPRRRRGDKLRLAGQ